MPLDEYSNIITPPQNGDGYPDIRPENFGVQTGEQNPGIRGRYWGEMVPMGALLWANGGTWDNPLAFPGYQYLYTGTYITYRWMLQHPVLRLVRSIAVSDILASNWEYGCEDTPAAKENLKLVQANMDHLRNQLMVDYFLRGRDYGWSAGEPVWEIKGTTTWLRRVKPLVVDHTEMLRDEFGNFTGLVNYVPVGKVQEVRLAAPYKAWRYTYDAEADYLYGRSWLENVRMTAWRDWLDCSQQLQKLGAKITGIQLMVSSPAGTFPGPVDPATGRPTPLNYRDIALKALKDLSSGSPGGWIPSLALNVDPRGKLDTARIVAELAKASLVNFQLLDHGSTTPAIIGILERMKHDEELMFAGGLRPARVGLEGTHGTKAEAGVHTDTGTKNAEVDDRDFAAQCQPLVDAILVLNRGQQARGTVWVSPPSLVDRKTEYLRSLMLAAMNDPAVAQEMMRVIDVDSELDFIGIARKNTFDPEKVAATVREQANTNKQPEPQGGRPAKGGGNPKKRPTPAK